MKRCINDKEMVLLARNDPEKGDIRELLEHIEICEKCREKVNHYRNEINRHEDYIKYDNWGGS